MEELILTSPVVQSKTTTKYRVASITLDLDTRASAGDPPGLIAITLRSNLNEAIYHTYTGTIASTLIRQLNVVNLSTKSLHKRIIERLVSDGILEGTISGVPD